MKSKKGSVTVNVVNGMIRLLLPRHLFNGKTKHLYLGLSDTPINRQAAQIKANAIANDIAFGNFDHSLEKYKNKSVETQDNIPDLNELWGKYEYFKFQSGQVCETTVLKDFKKIRNHIKKLPTAKIKDAKRIRDYLLDTVTTDTVKRVLVQINACCNWAVSEALIKLNPFSNLVPSFKKKHPKINPFTEGERDLIIKAFEEDQYARHYINFVKFLFYTGCRTSEAIGLRWEHIDKNLTRITFCEAIVIGKRKTTKTGKIRYFPINKQLKQLLMDMREISGEQESVFLSANGLLIDSHNFLNQYWSPVVKNLDVAYRPQYNTRHTFITLCLQAGIQVTQVAQWVGNTPKTIWEYYAGLVCLEQVPEF